MNTLSAVETNAPSSLKGTLYKVVPESIVGRILFWGALPVVFLFLTLGLSFLAPTSFSPYLPFLAVAGGLFCLRLRAIGLWGTYLALALLVFLFFPIERSLWQIGVLTAFAVDFLILYLAIVEVDGLIAQLAEFGKERVKELNQSQLLLSQTLQEKEELQRSLEEEIKQLKEEAEQRRIEKHQEGRRIELIQSEIEWLTSQKEHFISEARKGRQGLLQIEELKTYISALTDVQQQILGEKELLLVQEETLRAEVEALYLKVRTLSEQAALFGNEREALQLQLASLTDQAASFESDRECLRAQIDTLSEQVRDTEVLEAKVAALSSEKEALLERITRIDSEREALHIQAISLANIVREKEGIEATLKESLLSTQEKIIAFQQRPVTVVAGDIKALKGLHKQLRSQFDEKNRVLSETRKELFETQEKLLALQREQEEAALDLNGEEGNFIRQLAQEIESLEEEVLTLEELLSHGYPR